jgi:Arc/MetJ family transcription regulator
MTTNLALNDDLIREAQKLSGHRTKKAVITEALQEYVQRRKQMEIIHIFNQVEYDSDYDYKKQRQTP